MMMAIDGFLPQLALAHRARFLPTAVRHVLFWVKVLIVKLAFIRLRSGDLGVWVCSGLGFVDASDMSCRVSRLKSAWPRDWSIEALTTADGRVFPVAG